MSQDQYSSRYNKSWALVIGINDYRTLPPLEFARQDADSFAEVLRDTLGFTRDNVVVLLDGAASRDGIMRAFFALRDKASHLDDRVLVFFAGHGHTLQGSRGPVGFLVPVDGRPSELATLVPWDELTRGAQLIPAKHILFIMDACYSGLALRRGVSTASQRFLSDVLSRLSRQVITAGKADQVVADGGGSTGRNSIFTAHLLDGIRGQAADGNGILTASNLMQYVYSKVGQDPASDQTPQFGHLEGDGDLVLTAPHAQDLTSGITESFLTQGGVAESEPDGIEPVVRRNSFSQRNGYGDSSHPGFGRNDWTRRLGELEMRSGTWEHTVSPASSWLALVADCTASSPPIDIAGVTASLPNRAPPSGASQDGFAVPRRSMTTIDAAVFYDLFERRGGQSGEWSRVLRLDQAGHIEHVDSVNCFQVRDGRRCFRYVQIVGTAWQWLSFLRARWQESGYRLGATLRVCLVGTRDCVLTEFADAPGPDGTRWLQPFHENHFGQRLDPGPGCPSQNVALEYPVITNGFDAAAARALLLDVARKIALGFNVSGELRCFSCGTEEFPWRQFSNGRL